MYGKSRSVLVFACMLVVAFSAGPFSPVRSKQPKVLEFDSMVGVPTALTGAQNPIRGVNGGGLPWTMGAARGELKVGGQLEIEVRGLVFASGPNTGKNTVASFRGLVSCLRNDGTVANVLTEPFPATQGFAAEGGGNADIEANLALPEPCLAPIIFVTSPGGAWFAVTGR